MGEHFIALTLKRDLGSRVHIREDEIVWMHEDRSPGGGSIVCHTRGTVAVDQAVDQIKSKMNVDMAVFTVDSGQDKPVAIHVAVNHIRLVFQIQGKIRLRLTRGDYEILQGIEAVRKWLKWA